MKKKQKSRIWLGAVAIVLVVAVMIAFLSGRNSGKNYEEYTVKKGDIVRETKLAGQLQTEGSATITGPCERIIASVAVKENELVTAGQIIATLDVSEIEERIKEVEDRIETAEARLLSLDAEKTTKVLKASASGRVKEINKENFSDEKLILLSLDGRMRVAFESQEELNIGNAKIEVEAGDRKYDGVLYAQKDNAYIVTTDDAELMQGATVTIKANGEVIGTGVAEINVPYWITGELSNIESYAVSVNKSIQKGCELANLKVAVHTEAYDSALKECEEAEAELARMMSVKEDPYIYAPESGIIKELGIAEHMMIVGAAKEVVIGSIIPATPSVFVVSIPERYICTSGVCFQNQLCKCDFADFARYEMSGMSMFAKKGNSHCEMAVSNNGDNNTLSRA